MASLFLRDAMTVEEFLTAACQKKGLNPVENFVRVKKRREMSSAKYFVPHRSDLIETYVSHFGGFETGLKWG
jgi:T-lymphoma invasion and metastasis-inducing protein 1